MKLEELGYNEELQLFREAQKLDAFGVGRVISEHKERYIVKTDKNEFEAEIIGNLRHSALSRADFPAVGDWVAISEYDENKALIHVVFPRKTTIERQAVGKHGEKQIIATNIDIALIVQSVDRDYNINRIERYLTICNESKVSPIIILNKIDLISEEEIEILVKNLRERVKSIPVIAMSNETQSGINTLKEKIIKGKTYTLLGSSGVGKSTLLNNLAGKQIMETSSINEAVNRGRHITSHRELVVLENGGIIIDNPGMREVGIADSAKGLEITFNKVYNLARDCKFKNCTHTTELGCTVLEALENGTLETSIYDNYIKLEKEKSHFDTSLAERRKKDKEFGKIIKHFKKTRKSNKY